ncbi:phosphatase PAP2 family protein, partial [Devosia sp.]|uniref:phosphatase PAP2 family protein n=1 Tax=Devosia sp. TaxID=1871048 RepID=UPI00273337DC
KNIFARPRPEMAVYAESSFSFPSGHSAASVAFFGFLTYVLIRERIGPFFVSFLIGATLVFLIGLSRIYLVEHYLSDVLNGYLVGALWALLGIWLAEWLNTRRGRSGQTSVLPWQRVASIGVVVIALVAVGFDRQLLTALWPFPPASRPSVIGRNRLYSWNQRSVYINATSTRECMFRTKFAAESL